ncbi:MULTISPECIES: enoyl-CoA hydratase/isomerase family protein [Haloferax]|uniref:Enoyl-CoA hydratase n=2 Tax=Haloferax gibbonsii TaxID=35746 RepID=A0A0K1IZ25_HALGI|nr:MULTISPECIES: enoyl-CoA hydratase/isomerase family protein [Haloferax]AKU09573.1 enoyl-CoA hydratase [Haloferax gibbonsii]ELZ75933.1 enoyl-CoA hydratase [Haloferax gibbonsii ATCC 33959]QOS13948.1 enoyl-CoA hydratase [Haloferax gibbonsii]REA01668.1 enoyl-CoA hydratase/isomerase family protein [Haloferax sp. Atlit-6N]
MRVDDADGVRTVTFDRPEAKNAFTADVARELSAALEELTPEAFDAAVITGDGDAFSAGGDIRAMAERDETAREAYERVRGTLGRVAEAILTAPVPVVARVNGDAVGAGTSVVAACDFAYAARDARFGASFVNVGLVPDAGATVTLPRLVGLRAAKELAFTGKLISAERAAELDLVNEAVAAAALDATVDETVETLAAQPTETLALAKEAIHANLGRSWTDGLEREAHAQTLAYDTDAHEEGVSAFLEKRRPEFD